MSFGEYLSCQKVDLGSDVVMSVRKIGQKIDLKQIVVLYLAGVLQPDVIGEITEFLSGGQGFVEMFPSERVIINGSPVPVMVIAVRPVIAHCELTATTVVAQVEAVVEEARRESMREVNTAINAFDGSFGYDVKHFCRSAAVAHGRKVVILHALDVCRPQRLEFLLR